MSSPLGEDRALLEGHRWRCTRCGAEAWTMMARDPEQFLTLPALPAGWTEYRLASGHIAYRCRACPPPRARVVSPSPTVNRPRYTVLDYAVAKQSASRVTESPCPE